MLLSTTNLFVAGNRLFLPCLASKVHETCLVHAELFYASSIINRNHLVALRIFNSHKVWWLLTSLFEAFQVSLQWGYCETKVRKSISSASWFPAQGWSFSSMILQKFTLKRLFAGSLTALLTGTMLPCTMCVCLRALELEWINGE